LVQVAGTASGIDGPPARSPTSVR